MNVSQGLGNVCKVGGAKPIFSSFFPCNAIGLMLTFSKVVAAATRGAGTTLKLGGGKRLPGSQVTPTQNLKLLDLAHYFLVETQVHLHKQNQK